MPARKKTRKKTTAPVVWACKQHRVKQGGTCYLCRDQLELIPVPEPRGPQP